MPDDDGVLDAADEGRANDRPEGDAEPGKKRGRRRSGSRGSGRGPGRPSNLEKQLKDQLGTLGAGVAVFNYEDGAAILENTEEVALALKKLADEHDGVKRVLEGAMTGSVYFAVLAAFSPIIVRIAWNHGALPPAAALLAEKMGAPMGDEDPLDVSSTVRQAEAPPTPPPAAPFVPWTPPGAQDVPTPEPTEETGEPIGGNGQGIMDPVGDVPWFAQAAAGGGGQLPDDEADLN